MLFRRDCPNHLHPGSAQTSTRVYRRLRHNLLFRSCWDVYALLNCFIRLRLLERLEGSGMNTVILLAIALVIESSLVVYLSLLLLYGNRER